MVSGLYNCINVLGFVDAAKKLVIGDPRDDNTQVGATISKVQAEKVLGYINGAVAEVTVLSIENCSPASKMSLKTGCSKIMWWRESSYRRTIPTRLLHFPVHSIQLP